MKDIRIDGDGNFVCWKCGGRNFLYKRTSRSKWMSAGVGSALFTHKKLKCQNCGEYNQTGNAQTKPVPTVRSLHRDMKEALRGFRTDQRK